MEQYLPILYFVGAVTFGIGYLFIQYRSGGGKATEVVIAAYKEQVKLNQDKISTLTQQIGHLQGQLKEKDERIKILETTIQGKSPDQIAYMQKMIEVSRLAENFIKESTPVLKDLRIYLKKELPRKK